MDYEYCLIIITDNGAGESPTGEEGILKEKGMMMVFYEC